MQYRVSKGSRGIQELSTVLCTQKLSHTVQFVSFRKRELTIKEKYCSCPALLLGLRSIEEPRLSCLAHLEVWKKRKHPADETFARMEARNEFKKPHRSII